MLQVPLPSVDTRTQRALEVLHLTLHGRDLHDKVEHYLRPFYDSLEDMMPRERVQKAIENRTIEIAPLAYMRGRTLADAFVILDEAFFFQAEDGIRDVAVTGVQTCALPI